MSDNAMSPAMPGLAERLLRGKLDAMLWRLRAWATRIALALVVRLNGDSNYLRHLEREAGDWLHGPDGPNRWIAEGTRDLLAVFASQGHSGGSYGFAVEFFSKMARFEPWGPLTGEEHEWSEPWGDDGIQQNLRCSHVFRSPERGAYDINGKVFREPDGSTWTSRASCVPVTFPYTPSSQIVDVEKDEIP